MFFVTLVLFLPLSIFVTSLLLIKINIGHISSGLNHVFTNVCRRFDTEILGIQNIHTCLLFVNRFLFVMVFVFYCCSYCYGLNLTNTYILKKESDNNKQLL